MLWRAAQVARGAERGAEGGGEEGRAGDEAVGERLHHEGVGARVPPRARSQLRVDGQLRSPVRTPRTRSLPLLLYNTSACVVYLCFSLFLFLLINLYECIARASRIARSVPRFLALSYM